MLDDGQPQPRASQGTGTLLVDPVESLENPGPMLPGDAAAVVDAGQGDPLSRLGGGQGDALAPAVFQGVVEKIADGLGEKLGIPRHLEFFGDGQGEEAILLLRLVPALLHGLLGHLPQVDGKEIPPLFLLPMLQGGQGQDVLHQAVEALGLGAHQVYQPFQLLPGQAGGLLDGLRRHHNGGKGGLDFVGDVGDEVLPELLQLPHLPQLLPQLLRHLLDMPGDMPHNPLVRHGNGGLQRPLGNPVHALLEPPEGMVEPAKDIEGEEGNGGRPQGDGAPEEAPGQMEQAGGAVRADGGPQEVGLPVGEAEARGIIGHPGPRALALPGDGHGLPLQGALHLLAEEMVVQGLGVMAGGVRHHGAILPDEGQAEGVAGEGIADEPGLLEAVFLQKGGHEAAAQFAFLLDAGEGLLADGLLEGLHLPIEEPPEEEEEPQQEGGEGEEADFSFLPGGHGVSWDFRR